jgi:hypothetical protein
MQVSPSRTIKIGAKEFVLDGSFGTLRAVQEAFSRDVLQLLFLIPEMRLDQIATLIHIGSGKATPVDDIGQLIVDEIGAVTPGYASLKTELLAWINVAIAPKDAREKKRAEMQAIIDKTSPGTTTSDSASAS